MRRTWRMGAPTSSATDAGSGSGSTASAGQPNAGGETKPGETAAGAGEGAKPPEGQKPTDQGEQKPGDKAGAPAEKPKVPDKYVLKVPDDSKAFVDAAILTRFEAQAKASEMTNDEAQAFLEDQLTFLRSQATAWETETKADTTYGGEKLAETQRLAQRAIDRIRPDGHARRESFLTFLGRGGAGNNIEVVSFLADLGRMMSEDRGAIGASGKAGSGPAKTNEERARKLYDHADSQAAMNSSE